jgi:hypothetical protein
MLARLFIVFFAVTFGGIVYADELQDVSVVQLIANPELFNGREVRVIGFLHLEFEGAAVYLHREDFDYSVDKNSVAIQLSESQEQSWQKLNNHYVIIEGRFSSVAKGHFGARSGSLQNVTRLGDWSVNRSQKNRQKHRPSCKTVRPCGDELKQAP